MGRQRLLGIGLAAVTVLIFAGWFVVTRFAVTRALRPYDLAVLRFGIGLLFLFPALLPRLRAGAAARPGFWSRGFVLSLLWGTPFVLLLGYGIARTSAADASAVTPTLTAVFAGLIAWAVLRERPGRARLVGYAVTAIGVALLVVSHSLRGTEGSAATHFDLGGLAILLAASALWSVYTLLFRDGRLSAMEAGALICFWSTVVFVPPYLLLGLSHFPAASWNEIAVQAVYQGVLMSAVGIVTFNRAVVLLGPAAASAVVAAIPIVATVLAAVFLGETPPALALAGLPVIAAGTLLAARPAPPLRPARGL